jgi:hypothetical protein
MPQVTNYPGTIINEIDDSLASTPSYGSYAVTMGRATQGIANAKVLVNSVSQMVDTFGPPVIKGSYPLVSAVDYGIYSALQLLNETGNLWYVRLTDGSETYAGVIVSATGTSAVAPTSYTSAVSAAATSTYTGQYGNGNTFSDNSDLRSSPGTSAIRFTSVGPGSYGNNYAISVESPTVSSTWANSYDTITSAATAKWRKIFKVSVYVKGSTDDWTGLSETAAPEEIFYCSTDYTLVDNSGNSLFIEDVINGSSKYIYVRSGTTNGLLPGTVNITPLVSGADSSAFSSPLDSTGAAWNFFANKETSPINVALALPKAMNGYTTKAELDSINTVLTQRYDFITTLQTGGLSAYTEAAIKIDNGVVTIPSDQSYYAKYVGWTLVYDAYNSSRVYLPNSIFAAAVMLRTDRTTNPWEAPAGVERGLIPSGKQNFEITPAVGGKLYDINLNTIKFINGTGNVIWGQKTAQLKNTARNRINVRRALLYIEQNVEKILNNFLFRGNTVKERERATSMVNSFMQTVLAGGGVQSYKVVCDATNNNTSSNTLVVDLYVQPTYTIEFIKLNTIISASAVNTTEV